MTWLFGNHHPQKTSHAHNPKLRHQDTPGLQIWDSMARAIHLLTVMTEDTKLWKWPRYKKICTCHVAVSGDVTHPSTNPQFVCVLTLVMYVRVLRLGALAQAVNGGNPFSYPMRPSFSFSPFHYFQSRFFWLCTYTLQQKTFLYLPEPQPYDSLVPVIIFHILSRRRNLKYHLR